MRGAGGSTADRSHESSRTHPAHSEAAVGMRESGKTPSLTPAKGTSVWKKADNCQTSLHRAAEDVLPLLFLPQSIRLSMSPPRAHERNPVAAANEFVMLLEKMSCYVLFLNNV